VGGPVQAANTVSADRRKEQRTQAPNPSDKTSTRLNCTKFNHLILSKISGIVATRSYALKTWHPASHLILAGAPFQTPLRKLTALPHWLNFRDPTFKMREGRTKKIEGKK